MKKNFFSVLIYANLFGGFIFADSDSIILTEIKNLREDMNKRFEFIQALMIALIIGMIGSPFVIEYIVRRHNESDRLAGLL